MKPLLLTLCPGPLLLLVLSACTATVLPPIDRAHPASTDAPENSARPLRPMLGEDPATQRTRALLAKRAAEQTAAENESPGNATPIIAPATPNAPDHEHHQP